jgi:hypothetical protein
MSDLFGSAVGHLIGKPLFVRQRRRRINLTGQCNQMGMTRGVPSDQTYANRAGTAEWSNSWASGSFSKATSPCFVAIVNSSL